MPKRTLTTADKKASRRLLHASEWLFEKQKGAMYKHNKEAMSEYAEARRIILEAMHKVREENQ